MSEVSHTVEPLLLPATGRARWLVPVLCLLGALLVMPLDVIVARYCRHGDYPRAIGDVLNNAEPFGHAAGVVLIALTIVALDPRARWLAPATVMAALAGGLGANVLKLMISRTRPRNYDLLTGTMSDTWTGWLPWVSGGSSGQSFPSAHTATAVGLACLLCAAYPRGRWWFVTLAVLVGLHRIQAQAHYPSDVLAGAAVGWVLGQLVVAGTARNLASMTSRSQQTPQSLHIAA